MFFRLTTVITIVGGTLFLMWLGEQITARGDRQRHLADHLRRHHRAAAARAGQHCWSSAAPARMSPVFIIFFLLMAVAVIAFIVFMERAQRRILVQYPKRQQGNRMFGGESSHLPLKINTSGVIPPIFASSLLLMPATMASFAAPAGRNGWRRSAPLLGHGQPLYIVLLRRADRVLRASSTPRSCSIRRRRPRICASTAVSFRASGRASAPPNISTTC